MEKQNQTNVQCPNMMEWQKLEMKLKTGEKEDVE